MKAVHIISRIDQEASGLAHSVPNLCKNLAAADCRVELKCFAARGQIDNITLTTYPAPNLQSKPLAALKFVRALHQETSRTDILHTHSLWGLPTFAAGWVAPGKRAKLVVSPRGTLAPWALNWRRRRKQVMWPIQKRLLTHADLLHATSETEYEHFRALGLTAPVAIIPNGVDIPAMPTSTEKNHTSADQRTLLFLSRIHPIKGIDDLLHAWQKLAPKYPDWRLVIAGRGEPAHVKQVHQLAESLRLERVEFPGPLYGSEKSNAYFDADLFVLPTHTENFGIVIAEALAHGCPAIVTHGAPWPGLETEKCGWWIPRTRDQLTQTLDQALQLPPHQLAKMGQHGRDWMARDFSWSAVASQMLEAYRWVAGQNTLPICIQQNQ